MNATNFAFSHLINNYKELMAYECQYYFIIINCTDPSFKGK